MLKPFESSSTKVSEAECQKPTIKANSIFNEEIESIDLSEDDDQIDNRWQKISKDIFLWFRERGISQGYPENIVDEFHSSLKISYRENEYL